LALIVPPVIVQRIALRAENSLDLDGRPFTGAERSGDFTNIEARGNLAKAGGHGGLQLGNDPENSRTGLFCLLHVCLKRALTAQIVRPVSTKQARNRLQSEILIAEQAFTDYQKAHELEQKIS
jgi:hypothetical protein